MPARAVCACKPTTSSARSRYAGAGGNSGRSSRRLSALQVGPTGSSRPTRTKQRRLSHRELPHGGANQGFPSALAVGSCLHGGSPCCDCHSTHRYGTPYWPEKGGGPLPVAPLDNGPGKRCALTQSLPQRRRLHNSGLCILSPGDETSSLLREADQFSPLRRRGLNSYSVPKCCPLGQMQPPQPALIYSAMKIWWSGPPLLPGRDSQ
jgi:hypothetical protein